MKKILALLLVLALALGMAACGAKTEPAATEAPAANAPAADNAAVSADDIPDEMTSADGKYQVAFVTDVGTLKDKSFNQGTYDGVKLYANANGKTYKYYQPANGSNATDNDRIDAATLACENGAEVVVAAGFMQEAALRAAATKYPDVHFIAVDANGFDINSLTCPDCGAPAVAQTALNTRRWLTTTRPSSAALP